MNMRHITASSGRPGEAMSLFLKFSKSSRQPLTRPADPLVTCMPSADSDNRPKIGTRVASVSLKHYVGAGQVLQLLGHNRALDAATLSETWPLFGCAVQHYRPGKEPRISSVRSTGGLFKAHRWSVAELLRVLALYSNLCSRARCGYARFASANCEWVSGHHSEKMALSSAF